MKKQSTNQENLMDNPNCYVINNNDFTCDLIKKIATKNSINCSFFKTQDELLKTIESSGGELVFISDWLVSNIPSFSEKIKVSSSFCQIILITKENEKKDDMLKLNVDNFIFSPPSEKTVENYILDFIETRKRLKTLEILSLGNKKKDIFEEISSFSTHLKTISKMKQKSSELEDKIDELDIAKDRLAAEIRVKQQKITEYKVDLDELKIKFDSSEKEVEKLKNDVDSKSSDYKESLDCLDHISTRLNQLINDTGITKLTDKDKEISEDKLKIKRLEKEMDRANEIFDEIIATLTIFVSEDNIKVEDTFEKIITSLAEYTSI